jgi:hypothetical protein
MAGLENKAGQGKTWQDTAGEGRAGHSGQGVQVVARQRRAVQAGQGKTRQGKAKED